VRPLGLRGVLVVVGKRDLSLDVVLLGERRAALFPLLLLLGATLALVALAA
jgi:uncharacterized membrane protein YqjE